MSTIRTQACNDTFLLSLRRRRVADLMNEDCFSTEERGRSSKKLEACQDVEQLEVWRCNLVQEKARRQSQNITFPKPPIREVYEDEPINIHSRYRLKTQYAEQVSERAYQEIGLTQAELANL